MKASEKAAQLIEEIKAAVGIKDDDGWQAYWDEDAERLNKMAEAAKKFAAKIPESRAFCPTGEGGGIDNSCGSGDKGPKMAPDGAGGGGGGGGGPARRITPKDVVRLLEKISQSPDGFSLDPANAEQPTTGIMVSEFANDSRRSVKIKASDITEDSGADAFMAWLKNNSDLLENDPSRFVGGWKTGDDFYIDVATRFEPDKAEQALEAGRKSGQLAVFNLGTFKETWVKYEKDDERKPKEWDSGFARARKDATAKQVYDESTPDIQEEDWSSELTRHGKTTVRNYNGESEEASAHERNSEVRHSVAIDSPRNFSSVSDVPGEVDGQETEPGLVQGRAGGSTGPVRSRAYCPTGEGGGIDNSCSASEGSPDAGTATIAKTDSPPSKSGWKKAEGSVTWSREDLQSSKSPAPSASELGSLTVVGGRWANEALKNVGVSLDDAIRTLSFPDPSSNVVVVPGEAEHAFEIMSGNEDKVGYLDEITVTTVSTFEGSDSHNHAMASLRRHEDDTLELKLVGLLVSDDVKQNSRLAAARRILDQVPKMIANAEQIGVDKVTLRAAGEEGNQKYQGYKIWPRIGFDGEIPRSLVTNRYTLMKGVFNSYGDRIPDSILSPRAREEKSRGKLTVQALYETKEGQRWWERNGGDMPMSLDLRDKTSPGMTAFKKIRERVGARSFSDFLFSEKRELDLAWVEIRSGDDCGRTPDGKFGPKNDCQKGGEGVATEEKPSKDIPLGNVRRQDVLLSGGKSTAAIDAEATERAKQDLIDNPPPTGSPPGSTADLYGREFVRRDDPERPNKITSHSPVFSDDDLAQNGTYVSHDAVGRFLTGRGEDARLAVGAEGPGAIIDTRRGLPPEQFEHVVAALKRDVDRAYEEGRNPGFYSTDIAECMETMSGFYPELKDPEEASKRGTTPEDASFVFTMITAITSNGTDPALNLESADAIYRLYREHGSIRTSDDLMGGERSKEIKNSLERFQAMIDEFGEARVRAILSGVTHASTVNATMKKLAKRSSEIGGSWSEKQIDRGTELPDEVIPVAAIFGPKIGSFFANLSGRHQFLTMDRWLMRSVGRVTGELLTRSTPEAANKQANAALRAIRDRARSRDILFGVDKPPLNLKRDDVIRSLEVQARTGVIEESGAAYQWAIAAQRAYSKVPRGVNKEGKPTGSYGNHPDPQIRAAHKAGNTIFKSLIHEQQDPRSAGARRVLREVFKEVAARVAKETNSEVQVSEIQAVLWQYEQNLWKRLGAKTKIEGDSLYSAAANGLKQRRESGEPLRTLRPVQPNRPKSVRSYDLAVDGRDDIEVDYQSQSGQDVWDGEVDLADIDFVALLKEIAASVGVELRAFCPTGPDGGIDNSCSPSAALPKGQDAPAESSVKFGDKQEEIDSRLESLGVDMGSALAMAGGGKDGVYTFIRRDHEKPEEGGLHIENTRDVAGVKDGMFSTTVIRNAGTEADPEIIVDHKLMDVLPAVAASPEKRHAAAREFLRTMTESVESAVKSGASKVVLNAAGNARGDGSKRREIDGTSFRGYTMWPRMGFDAPLPFDLRNKLPKDLDHCRTLLDLHATPAGTRWWRKNGTDIDVQMDLTRPDSPQMQVFGRFVRHFERDRRELAFGTGEGWLSPADEAKLDSLWNRIWDDGLLDDYDGEVEDRAFCPTGPGGGIDNSCGGGTGGPRVMMAPDGAGGGGSSRWGGETQDWGKSSDTETFTSRSPLFPGAENLASIRIYRPNDVKGIVEDELKLQVSDAVLAAGPIIESAKRAGITMPRLEITPGDFGGIDMHWSAMGVSTGEGFRGEEAMFAPTPGTAVKAAEASRRLTMERSGPSLYMSGFFIHPDFQGRGIALDSVLRSTSAPVVRLRMDAERFDSADPSLRMTGYSAWPRFGYDAPISEVVRVLSQRGVTLPKEYEKAKSLVGIYALPGGADFWRQHGGSIALTFDTRPRSVHREILLQLRDRKRKSEGRNMANDLGGQPVGVDSDFDPVVDEVWADIVSGKIKLTGTVPTQEEWDQWNSERQQGATDGDAGEVQPH